MKIGELATRSGKTIHTLRYYEEQGLMPSVRRDDSGHRKYVEAHLGWLQFLDRLRCAGMSLADMQHYAALVLAGATSLTERISMLDAQLSHVEDQIRELELSRTVLAAKLAYYRAWQSNGAQPAEGWAPVFPPKA